MTRARMTSDQFLERRVKEIEARHQLLALARRIRAELAARKLGPAECEWRDSLIEDIDDTLWVLSEAAE